MYRATLSQYKPGLVDPPAPALDSECTDSQNNLTQNGTPSVHYK